ncbi:MAG: phosphodiester glycosidase family protein [Oscillospiraceae bacterium]|nr:phosphodiester glycosidase family protein [Oscillospiraceae bacterium]
MSGAHGKKKKKSGGGIVIAVLLLAALLGVGGFFVHKTMQKKNAVAPQTVLADYLDSLGAMDSASLSAAAGVKTPTTEDGRALLALAADALSVAAAPAEVPEGETAALGVTVTTLDVHKLAAALNAPLNDALAAAVEEARVASEIYDENWQYRGEVVRGAFSKLLSSGAADPSACLGETALTARLSYDKGVWTLENPAELSAALFPASLADPDAAAETLFTEASAELRYVPKHYAIEIGALAGPVPAEENFGSTRDKAVIRALLERPEAKALIGEQTLAWNEDIVLLEDSQINYYLDETILVLNWQELTANAVGTYSEIFVGDGSQLVRRITGDDGKAQKYKFTTVFAKESNAVLTISGDFYMFVYRDSALEVQNRKIEQFWQGKVDTCFFNANGDMLFVPPNYFADEAACEQYIADNDIVFSLSFGPVLINDGVDVTPASYPFGEINDAYARAAVGMLGERHYLTMDINYSPIHYNLATLRQATEAMLAHGCVKAYALDGGQTAHTVFHGTVINPLQNPWEKEISDALCFVSAYPGEE